METTKQKKDMQQLIGNTLRIGVIAACIVAAIGGAAYLIHHGGEPMPDYTKFHGEPAAYTSLGGIWDGVKHLHAREWMQMGAIFLILTPIARILLSLFDFARERDWLYVVITSIVFLVILFNSLSL